MKHMRKTLLILLALLGSVALQAQGKFTRSFEIAAGAGFSGGPVPTVLPEYVFTRELDGGFHVGAGIGLQLVRNLQDDKITDGVRSKVYLPEISVPVFVRFGYTETNLFARVDAGYALGLLCFDDFMPYPGAEYKGFFFEPQVGYKLDGKQSLALGLLLHQNTIRAIQTFTSGGMVTSESTRLFTVFTPALTIRYIITLK